MLNWLWSELRARSIAREIGRLPGRRRNLPIVYVPGILGVKLFDRDQGTYVWGDYRGTLLHDQGDAPYALHEHERRLLANEQLHHFAIVPGLLSTLVTA